MNFAILGTGIVADYHKAAIEANADAGASLHAVCHYDPAKFDDISNQFGVRCITFEELVRDTQIDAVCICTPSGQHAQQAIACAKAGKHLVVEKPITTSVAEAEKLASIARANGVRVTVALQRRTEPLFIRIKNAIEAGDLGELTLASVVLPYFRGQAYYDQAPWRGTWALDGGGVLMNQGIHIIDLLVWYMGFPVEIQAQAGTLHRNIEVEDVLAANLRFENGALATITASTTVGGGAPHRIELYGTNGSIQVEGEGVVRWHLKDESIQTVSPPALSTEADAGSSSDPRGITALGHTAIVKELMEAIKENRDPTIDAVEGTKSLALVNAIYRAAGYARG